MIDDTHGSLVLTELQKTKLVVPLAPFSSPLARPQLRYFDYLNFGRLTLSSPELAIRKHMAQQLETTFEGLPERLRGEVRRLLDGYSASTNDFFSLFYPFIWSFFFWLPKYGDGIELPNSAVRAHALSLFLHLWDDHLTDGQLSVDALRLHMRTVAWDTFEQDCREICRELKLDQQLIHQATGEYLNAIHVNDEVSNIEDYCERFVRQTALVRVVPALCCHWIGRSSSVLSLVSAIRDFAMSWRIIDDLADVDDDVLTNNYSAVWYSLDEAGRQHWEHCHALAREAGRHDEATFKSLVDRIKELGAADQLLMLARNHLFEAEAHCLREGWHGLTSQVRAMIERVPEKAMEPHS